MADEPTNAGQNLALQALRDRAQASQPVASQDEPAPESGVAEPEAEVESQQEEPDLPENLAENENFRKYQSSMQKKLNEREAALVEAQAKIQALESRPAPPQPDDGIVREREEKARQWQTAQTALEQAREKDAIAEAARVAARLTDELFDLDLTIYARQFGLDPATVRPEVVKRLEAGEIQSPKDLKYFLLEQAQQSGAVESQRRTLVEREKAVADREAQLAEAVAKAQKAERLKTLQEFGLTDVPNTQAARSSSTQTLQQQLEEARKAGQPLKVLKIKTQMLQQ